MTGAPNRILVVDDEQVARDSLAAWLHEDGHQVETAACGNDAIACCRAAEYDLCFLDLKMPPGPDGIATLIEIRRLRPEISVVIMTAYATIDTAVQAIKEGAEDYLVKPFNLKEISLLVERVLRHRQVKRENLYLRRKLAAQFHFQDLVSKNPRMHEIFALVREVAGLRSTVLIQGESGVGKELVARAIHDCGDRKARPFLAVSCTALTETLLESELFGHERGAFTGAVSRKKGTFELAEGGTLFLDEIGEIPPKVQMDLLRVLEQRKFFRVGGTEEVELDARFIAAANRDLKQAVQDGSFRSDLYYRLNVISIHIPPLRARPEDIPLLTEHFIERLSIELGKQVTGVTEEAMALLLRHDWPGNVRELRNSIERAIATARSARLGEEDFSFLKAERGRGRGWEPPTELTLSEVEKQVIEAVLKSTGGNVREAAVRLGIDRSTLYDKIRRYELPRT